MQYQPETGEPIKLKDCSLRLEMGAQVYVVFDSKAPADARTYFEEGSYSHWLPALLASVPIGVAGLLLIIGACRLWEGIQDRN